MAHITNPVGRNGVNARPDVKTVQRLLNRIPLTPLRRLTEDGLAGPQTVAVIEEFQRRIVGYRSPDGRIDPGGKSMRALKRGPSNGSANPPSGGSPNRPFRGAAQTPSRQRPTPRVARRERGEFVKSGVKELPTTARIIDAIRPHFKGIKARVISGFMNDADLHWKVNYHWEYLLWMIEHSLTVGASDRHLSAMRAIRGRLLESRPKPDRGYRTSGKVGVPEDTSGPKAMDRRHKLLAQSKRDFKRVIQTARLKTLSKRTPKSFDYSVAPVAHPGTSKHATGYAIDIAGNNSTIKNICSRLGASQVFDEKSHVHVEFKNGASG